MSDCVASEAFFLFLFLGIGISHASSTVETLSVLLKDSAIFAQSKIQTLDLAMHEFHLDQNEHSVL